MINFILLLINFIIINAIERKLKLKWGILLYSYPIAVFIASNFFDLNFLSLGDGESYFREYVKYFVNNSELIEVNSFSSLLDYLKISNFGIVPLFYIINEYIENEGSDVYFSLQASYYLVLMFIAILLAYSKEKKYLTAFKIVSASCILMPFVFELLSAPTRHTVTLVSGFLIYFSYKNIRVKFNFINLIVFLIAVLLLLISKAILFPFFITFILFDLYFYDKTSKINILIFLFMLILIIGVNLELLLHYVSKYNDISEAGSNTFSPLLKIWLVGWAIKYIYAILSPFPWFLDNYALDLIYGGNIILYFAHIFSSILVLYLFICVIFEFKNIYFINKDASNSILYGLVMSSSILFGATGFNIYLIIWVPFLMPAIFYARYGYFYLTFAVSFPILCEFLIFLLK